MKKAFYIFFSLLLCALTAHAQGIKVSGKVIDNTNEAIIGGSIIVKNTSIGTITDLDGNFSLTVPSKNAVLVFSYVGMQTKEITLGDKTSGITVTLSPETKLLEEVVVVGFGTQKKINLTGAVKSIDNKVFESRPIANAVQGLQGAIAGLNIINDNGGAPGQRMQINIRGVGTIGTGSNATPLILIDGIEGDLSSINPNDIENVSVLKDAAAAAIYGSRAPFGVILVTTKSGVEQKTQFTYTGNVRVSNPVSIPDVVDSYTYALMVNDAYINAGGNPPFSSSQINKILKYQKGELPYGIEKAEGINDWAWNQRSFGNTDWYQVHLKPVTYSQEHNLSARGGTKTVSYFLSANYLGDRKSTRLNSSH